MLSLCTTIPLLSFILMTLRSSLYEYVDILRQWHAKSLSYLHLTASSPSSTLTPALLTNPPHSCRWLTVRWRLIAHRTAGAQTRRRWGGFVTGWVRAATSASKARGGGRGPEGNGRWRGIGGGGVSEGRWRGIGGSGTHRVCATIESVLGILWSCNGVMWINTSCSVHQQHPIETVTSH